MGSICVAKKERVRSQYYLGSMMVARKVRDRFEFEAQQPSDVERLK